MDTRNIVIFCLIVLIVLIVAVIIWIGYSYSTENQGSITKKIYFNDLHYYYSGKLRKIKNIVVSISGNFIKRHKEGRIVEFNEFEKTLAEFKNKIEGKVISQRTDLYMENKNYPIHKEATLENIAHHFFHALIPEIKQLKCKLINLVIKDNEDTKVSYFKYNPSNFML